MGDERCVAADDPDANQRLVREALIEPVGGVGSFHPMSCDEGPEAYERLVAEVGAFDVVHLGLGPDGHTASLFSGSAALDAPRGRLVVRSADPDERNPHQRMSLTLEALARALLVLFTVSGEAKHEAFAPLSAGADLPAARVRARQVLWLVDREAAGRLGGTGPGVPHRPAPRGATGKVTAVAPDDLLAAATSDLQAEARALRARVHGNRVTYSPKVFIPLTMLCRDRCGYCTFAKPPARVRSPYMSSDEVLAVARAGAAAGCHEALFTLGEAPEERYPVAAPGSTSTGTPRPSTTWWRCARWCAKRPGSSPTPMPARSATTSWPACAPSPPARA